MAWDWMETKRDMELPDAACAVLNNWAAEGYPGSKVETSYSPAAAHGDLQIVIDPATGDLIVGMMNVMAGLTVHTPEEEEEEEEGSEGELDVD